MDRLVRVRTFFGFLCTYGKRGRMDLRWQGIRTLRSRRRVFFGHAALVGAAAGGLAVLFQIVLDYAFKMTLDLAAWSRAHHGLLILPLLCSACGLSTALITKRWCPEAAGSGIPQVKGVLMHLGNIRWARVLAVKFMAGLLVIGGGFTLGREGPTIHLGAAVGLALTKLLHLPHRLRLHYVACGAGAGLAAAFNAPLAGFVFVLEELRREMSPLTYGTALVATVTADVVTRFFMGSRPSLLIPVDEGADLLSLRILPIAVLAGLHAGLLGGGYSRLLVAAVRRTGRKEDIWMKYRAATCWIGSWVLWILPTAHTWAGGLAHP